MSKMISKRMSIGVAFIILLQIPGILCTQRNARNTPVGGSSSKIGALVANHMKLARLANVVHLQTALLKGSISTDDVVKGIWNFPDEIMTQLAAMKSDDVGSQMSALAAALQAVPGDLNTNDVEKVTEKFKPLAELRKGLGSVKAALNYSNVPDIATASSTIPYLKNIKGPKECVDLLTKIQNANGNTKISGYSGWCAEASICTSQMSAMKNKADSSMKAFDAFLAQDASDRALGPLTAGIRVVQGFASSSADFKDLAQNEKKVEDLFGNYKQLLALPKTNPKLQVVLEFLKQLTDSIRFPKPSPDTVGAAFTQDQNPKRAFDDIRDSWVLDVLNSGKSLEKLESGLKPLRLLSDHLGSLSRNFKILSEDHALDALSSTNQLVSLLKTVDPLKFPTIFLVPTCLGSLNATQVPKEADEIVRLSEQLMTLEEPVKELKAELEKIKVDNDRMTKLGTAFLQHSNDPSKPIDADLLKFGIDHSTELAIQVDAVNAVFKKYPQLAALQPLNGTDEIDEVKKWIVESKLSDSSTCDLQNLDESTIQGIGAFAGAVEKVKSGHVLAQMKSIEMVLANSIAVMQRIRNEDYDGNEEVKKVSLHFSPQNAPNLLDVAIGVETLRELDHVYMEKTDMQAVVEAEKTVSAAIQKNTNHQDKLKAVWNGFGSVSQMLTDFGGQMGDLEKKMAGGDQKSLDDVSGTYSTAGSVKFAQKINLKPFIDSFPLFAPTGNDLKSLQKSFDQMDQVALRNLDLAFARFQKVPPSLDKFYHQLNVFNADGADSTVLYIFIGIGVLLLLVAIAVLIFVIYKKRSNSAFKPNTKVEMLVGDGTGPVENFVPLHFAQNPMFKKYQYVLRQDAFLSMNAMPNNRTELFECVVTNNWDRVDVLIKAGALVDVPNDMMQRTALFQVLLVPADTETKKRRLRALRGAGASVFTQDMKMYHPRALASNHPEVEELIKQWATEEEAEPIGRRVMSPDPREYCILVVDPNAMSMEDRNKLSPIIKNRITWGYNFDRTINLDKYTHIVLPDYYNPRNVHNRRKNKKALALDDNDLIRYHFVASLGNLMNDEWLKATIDKPKTLMYEQDYMIIHMAYGKDLYTESLLRLKTDRQRLFPQLFYGAHITILCSEGNENKKMEWDAIIPLFGGVVANEAVPDQIETCPPYHTMSKHYRDVHGAQNRAWVLTIGSCMIREDYQEDVIEFTYAPVEFLARCIANYHILPTCNTIVRMLSRNAPSAERPLGLNENIHDTSRMSAKMRQRHERRMYVIDYNAPQPRAAPVQPQGAPAQAEVAPAQPPAAQAQAEGAQAQAEGAQAQPPAAQAQPQPPAAQAQPQPPAAQAQPQPPAAPAQQPYDPAGIACAPASLPFQQQVVIDDAARREEQDNRVTQLTVLRNNKRTVLPSIFPHYRAE